MNTKEAVYAALQELSGAEQIKDTDQLQADLGLDSVLLVAFLLALEEKLQIVFSESDLDPFALRTVRDAILLGEKYGNKTE